MKQMCVTGVQKELEGPKAMAAPPPPEVPATEDDHSFFCSSILLPPGTTPQFTTPFLDDSSERGKVGEVAKGGDGDSDDFDFDFDLDSIAADMDEQDLYEHDDDMEMDDGALGGRDRGPDPHAHGAESCFLEDCCFNTSHNWVGEHCPHWRYMFLNLN